MHSGERGIVGGHAEILEAGDGVHAGFGHIMLGEYSGELFRAVVAVVEEDHSVALLDGAVDSRVVDRLDKLVGYIGVVAGLNGSSHVGGLGALAVDEEVVGYLDALPTLVAVHGVVADDNRCDLTGAFCAVGFELLDKSFA